MMRDIRNSPLEERFDHLLKVFSSDRFRNMEGLGNEVPFFICAYDPDEAEDMRRLEDNLVRRLAQKGIHVLIVDLYDLSLELLHKRNIFERVLSDEEQFSKAELKELLQNTLDAETHLIPAIGEKMEGAPFDMMFITGVGEVFPYIRSHNVLNNLQSTAKDCPTVMFFPGEYSFSEDGGASLDLFGLLHDDNYYRAFDIYQYQA